MRDEHLQCSPLRQRTPPLALLHLILWLIHAVVKAIASALVDVFTSLTGILISAAVVVTVLVGLAGAFGLGGLGFAARRRRQSRREL